MITLYNYYRSSASYRVRIALNIKGLAYTNKQIHLINNGGEQHATDYQKINPQQLVPSLESDGQVFTQSLAIIEYLEEKQPLPSLLPKDLAERAHARSLAQMVACDIHPLNNLRVLNYLQQELNIDESEKKKWYHHWLKLGLDALTIFVNQYSTSKMYCYKNQLTIADLCLIPQLYNARRFAFPVENYPTLCQIEKHCLEIPAFKAAHPDKEL